MTLKILGGEFGGRILKAPKGVQTRPTTSMLRKAVFDILQPKIQDAIFLDLFAGSGAMGIEALSRGAQQAIFVDSHRDAIRCLKENLALLNIESKTHIIQNDVFRALTKLYEMKLMCDVIYADPPYDKPKLYQELMTYFDKTPLLKPQGILFIESPSPSPLEKLTWTHFKPLPVRKYGDSELWQFIRI